MKDFVILKQDYLRDSLFKVEDFRFTSNNVNFVFYIPANFQKEFAFSRYYALL